MNLGTERHKKQYFDAIDKFQIPGDSHTTHEYKTSSTITQVQS